jgi:hypothetical protein
MPDGSKSLTIRGIDHINSVTAEQWDACVGDANPFLSHAFLRALEESGSATAATGWAPHHLLVENGDGRLLACAPLYLKDHSYGEYVFDWGWAEAWQRAGRRYYPKLQCAVPFTPVTGGRLLVRPEAAGRGLETALAAAMVEIAQTAKLSSIHITFCTEAEAQVVAGQGWLPRMGQQYHWHNDGYASFDDFLAVLASRKRKDIRKERERANALGLTIRTLSGDDLRPRHWDAFYRFYMDTSDRKWGQAYLTRDFFRRLGAEMADRVVLILAEQDGLPVAGALNLRGGDTLYGRNWGSDGAFRFLHFEMCYYRAIDYAIEHRLARVEAGAQGEHKISRGYLPVPTWSAHWIRETPLRRAVADFLDRERVAVAEEIQDLAEHGPFRKEDHGAPAVR